MDDLEKLELIHCGLQEIANGCNTEYWMHRSLQLLEELREPLLIKQAKFEQKKEQDFELGSNYGREMGWYSGDFGDSYADY